VRKLITIRNNMKQGIIRANRLFPAGTVVVYDLDTSNSKFKEIKACSALKILKYEDIPPVSDEPVLKVKTPESEVVPPEPVIKVEEPVIEEPVVEEPVVEAPPPPPPAPEVDTTPVVVKPEAPLPDVTELEVAETEDVAVVVPVSCPYCDFTAPKKTGVFHHVRFKHPDNYEEYRERLKKS
jgi:hypothetical protein